MIDLFDEFRAVIAALEAAQVPYAVCGGLAVAAYGHARATQDIDLLIAAERVDGAAVCLARRGYLEGSRLTLAHGRVSIRRLVKTDQASGDHLMVDLLAATDAVADAWHGRRRLETEAGPVWFASREGLIAMKRLRGSRQDLADIERLEGGNDAP